MKKFVTIHLLFFDAILAAVAWSAFFYLRKRIEIDSFDFRQIFHDPVLYKGVFVMVVYWVFLWWLLGIYDDVKRKSRTQILWLTTIGCTLTSTLLLLTVIRDDLTHIKVSYLYSFGAVLTVHLAVFCVGRMLFFSILKALLAYDSLSFKGLFFGNEKQSEGLPYPIRMVAHMESLKHFTREDLVNTSDTIVINSGEQEVLRATLPKLIGHSGRKSVLIHEDVFRKIKFEYSGIPSVRSSYVALRTSPLEPWQLNIKRCIDVVSSVLAIVLLSPVLIYLWIRVKLSSKGPVIFRQTRIGRYGNQFEILKFRSMYQHAEKDGPMLATANDERCTPLGLWMRRWRLDELPQFFNVLWGDMSLVGPRPERPFYHNQLVERTPKYALLQQVRPGITSWGQIKFGYAGDLDEMLQRFRYDLLYIENMNILLDFRIIIFTVLVLFQGKGR